MVEGNERFGYGDAANVQRNIGFALREHGMNRENIKQMVILGSGLGGFAEDYLDLANSGNPSGPVVLPFNNLYRPLNGGSISTLKGEVKGHARSLVIGPMKGSTDGSLVMAQSGREHPYEGVSTKRATFWLRVAQLMGVQDLVGSNASGILTPRLNALEQNDLMLVHSDADLGDDSPLKGENSDDFGPRFPHKGDFYPEDTRNIVKGVATQLGIALKEGTYVRMPGPSYESAEDVYRLRALLEGMWQQGRVDGDQRFLGDTIGVVGMSSTFENMVAQHASQSKENPALKNRAYISVATNYAAMLGPRGLIDGTLKHDHVKDSADSVRERMGALVQGTLLEMRRRAA